MLTKQQKDRIIKKYATHEKDTGSPEVQIAILTAEIKFLTDHLKEHKKDHSSRRGLLRKVNERRRLLRYLEREDEKRHEELIKSLKLKMPKRLISKRERDEMEKARKAAEKEEAESGGK